MTDLLLFTPRAARDLLGRAIVFFEGHHATFVHAALHNQGTIVEAHWPRVRMLVWPTAQPVYDGASERIPLKPVSAAREGQVWHELVTHMVGQPYSLPTLAMDALGRVLPQMVVRLGGSVVCSSLAARYVQLIGDPRLPSWRDPDSVTPADLGQLFVGRRLSLEGWQQQEVSHG